MGLICLIRHGQTAWNKEEVFRGTTDVPLDHFGRKQAAALGPYLEKRGLKKPLILTSPLMRALETGQLCAQAFPSAAVKTDQAFTDLDFGSWQGQSKNEVARLYPDLFEQWQREPEKVVFPGGENLSAVAGRAEPALHRLAAEEAEKDLIIVTHRVVTKVLLGLILGAGLQSFWKIRQDTACINTLEYKPPIFIVNKLNDTAHLYHIEADN